MLIFSEVSTRNNISRKKGRALHMHMHKSREAY